MYIFVAVQYILISFYTIDGELMESSYVFSPSELLGDGKFSNISYKPALRYGFHRTSECDNYEKAFLCVQKCVDKGFDVAYSDKYCFCTCYVKKEKAKYTPARNFTRTKWKLGTPSTTMPPWIQKLSTAVKNKTKTTISIIEETHVTVEENFTDISNGTNVTESLIEGNLTTDANTTTGNETVSDDGNVDVNATEAQNITTSDNVGNVTSADGQNITEGINQNATVESDKNLANDTSTAAPSAPANGTISDVTNSTGSQNASEAKS